MNHEPTPDEIAAAENPAARVDDRPMIRRFALSAAAVVLLVLGVAIFFAQTKATARTFLLAEPVTREARTALLLDIKQELATIVAVDRGAKSPYERYRRDVLVVAAAVQLSALSAQDNAPPRTLEEAGLRPDDLAPDVLYQSSGVEWRLLSRERLVLARGN